MSAPSKFWTVELMEEVQRRYRDGDSAGFIRQHMDLPTTRSSICGMLWRAGVHRGNQPTNRSLKTGFPANSNRRQPKPPSKPPKPQPNWSYKRRPRYKPQDPAPPPASDPVQLLQITRRQCHWALDDPGLGRMDETMFCGAPTAPHSAYCPFHRSLSLDPQKRRYG